MAYTLQPRDRERCERVAAVYTEMLRASYESESSNAPRPPAEHRAHAAQLTQAYFLAEIADWTSQERDA